VVDTEDLPLNVSREVTQSSPAMTKIRNSLITKVLSFLQGWADNNQEKYAQFYKNFGPLLKIGVNSDFENREKIIELLRFESSLKQKGELTSLKEYAAKMNKEQKEIYYLSGESREILERNPNLEYFKKKNIEVLFLADSIDVFVIPAMDKYQKIQIKSIEKADISLMPEDKIEKIDNNLSKSLLSLFNETLRDKVEDVVESKRLVDSAVTLVVGKEGIEPQMEKMMQIMNKDFKRSKKIMEVNMSHPLIRNLSKIYLSDTTNPLLRKCVLQLYEGALLVEGDTSVSGNLMKRMVEIMEEATNK
jgi:molecular chaperone HtpG